MGRDLKPTPMRFEDTSERLLVNSLEAWIKSNLSKNIRLQIAASNFNMNEDDLSQLVMTVHGFSYSEMLRLLRLEEATKLLRETDIPISSIAGVVGYSATSSLLLLVRQYERMSPMQYRNKHKKKLR